MFAFFPAPAVRFTGATTPAGSSSHTSVLSYTRRRESSFVNPMRPKGRGSSASAASSSSKKCTSLRLAVRFTVLPVATFRACQAPSWKYARYFAVTESVACCFIFFITSVRAPVVASMVYTSVPPSPHPASIAYGSVLVPSATLPLSLTCTRSSESSVSRSAFFVSGW